MERIFAVMVLGLCSLTLIAGPDMDTSVTMAGPNHSQETEGHGDSKDGC